MDYLGVSWIQLTCLHLLIYVMGCLGQTPTLSISPINTAVYVGDSITLNCQVNQADVLTEYVSWDECITEAGGGCRRISNDQSIVYSALGGDPSREARYSITNTATKQYNLVISGTLEEDAGRYRCTARNDANQYVDVEVILLAATPACQDNLTTYTDEPLNYLPAVHAQCSVGYYGTIAPVTTFQIVDSEGSVTREQLGDDRSTTGNSIYSKIYQLQLGDHGQYLMAKTHFNSAPPGDSMNMADNIPSFSEVQDLGQLTGTGSRSHASSLILSTVAIVLQLVISERVV